MLLSLLVMTVTVTKLHQLVLIVVKVAKKLYKAFKRKEMRMKVNNKPPQVCKWNRDVVDYPLAKIGGFSHKHLCEEQSNCESLTKCRNWGKIIRRVISMIAVCCYNNHDASEDKLNNAVIVISKVLEGHDQSGLLCIANPYSIISKSFTWPRISRDIHHMCRDIKLVSLILKRHLLKPLWKLLKLLHLIWAYCSGHYGFIPQVKT